MNVNSWRILKIFQADVKKEKNVRMRVETHLRKTNFMIVLNRKTLD